MISGSESWGTSGDTARAAGCLHMYAYTILLHTKAISCTGPTPSGHPTAPGPALGRHLLAGCVLWWREIWPRSTVVARHKMAWRAGTATMSQRHSLITTRRARVPCISIYSEATARAQSLHSGLPRHAVTATCAPPGEVPSRVCQRKTLRPRLPSAAHGTRGPAQGGVHLPDVGPAPPCTPTQHHKHASP